MHTSAKGNREFFVWRDGRAADDTLHQAILDQGDHKKSESVSRGVGKRVGLSDADIDALMGKPKEKAMLTVMRKEIGDIDPPDDDENFEDFMDRCVEQITGDDDGADQDAAADQCQMLWDERRAGGKRGLPPRVYKTHADSVNGMEYVLSDETPDRMGDVISATGWDVGHFTRNPIALFNHRADFPIGKWSELRVEDGALRGRLTLAPKGTSDRIDEIRRLIDAGILRAVSVGFRPSAYEPIKDADGHQLGYRFTKQELLETSLVSVPANPNALQVAKSLKISPATIDLVFAGQGRKGAVSRWRGSPGGQARRKTDNDKGTTMSPLAQRIKDAELRLVALKDQLRTHFEKIDDTNVTDAQLEATTELNGRIDQEERGLAALRDSERHLAETSDSGGRSVAIITTRTTETNGRDSTAFRPFSVTAKKVEPLEYLVRAGTVALFSHLRRKPLDEVRQELYGDDEATRVVMAWAMRGATAPAMTTVTGWAAELVQQIVVDFMQSLMPKSVFPRLSAMGLGLTFGRFGRVIIPTRALTPTIAGSFVGEGQPIPVRQGAFTSQTLTPKKMAVITSWTREIDETSQPAIEGLLRNAVQEDTAVSLDSVLLDANPATVIRPAGIFNGVAPLTPTTGGGFAALVGDIKQVSGALLTATRGNLRNPAWPHEPAASRQCGPHGRAGRRRFPVP